MDTEPVESGALSEGDLLVVDGEPCAVTDTEQSEGGKHGTGKVTIEAVGLTDGESRTLTQPADAEVEMPVFERERNPLVLTGGEDHFDPVGVRVAEGSGVVWLWDDEEPHRLVAADGVFDSGREAGEGYTVEHEFGESGVYLYRCAVHDRRGVVVVE
jgi:plastocyanin